MKLPYHASLPSNVGTWALFIVVCNLLLTTLSPSDAAEPSPLGQKIPNFTLRDYRGHPTTLNQFEDQELVVVAFLGTECPLAKLYGPRLAALDAQYKSRNVAFLGINANSQDSLTEIAAYARIHNIQFPILKDLSNQVADRMGAVRTPEVFVLDRERVIRYWGRIDDQYGVGYLREAPQRQDLATALDELLAGQPVSLAITEAVGCHIGRVHAPRPSNSKSDVNYSEHIAPLLQNRCVECHRPGQIAPFSLIAYDEVAGWAETIEEVVRQGRMPPWHADPKYGKFTNDRRLTEAEKQLIYDWVQAGAPQGDPAKLPAPAKFTDGWQLPQQPDQIVTMRKVPFTVQAEGTADYQYFTTDPGFTEDKWVKMVEVRPGNSAVVHHVLVFVKTATTRFGDGEGFLGAYVPGMLTSPFPSGLAKRIPARAKLYFQVHYTPIGSPQLDNSMIGLVFANPREVRYEVMTASAMREYIYIPPHAADHCLEATSGSVGVDVLLLSMMPHMHLRGKSFRYELLGTDGNRQMLLDVPRYDFNWQTSYRLAEPKSIPAGAKIHCTAHYDNSEANLANPDPTARVRFGPQSTDEMMFGYFDYAVPIESLARHR